MHVIVVNFDWFCGENKKGKNKEWQGGTEVKSDFSGW